MISTWSFSALVAHFNLQAALCWYAWRSISPKDESSVFSFLVYLFICLWSFYGWHSFQTNFVLFLICWVTVLGIYFICHKNVLLSTHPYIHPLFIYLFIYMMNDNLVIQCCCVSFTQIRCLMSCLKCIVHFVSACRAGQRVWVFGESWSTLRDLSWCCVGPRLL